MDFVYAKNAKGHKQRFTRASWDAIGKNKNGWYEVASQAVDNTVDKAPDMGPKKVIKPAVQTVDNKLETKTDQKADNNAGLTEEEILEKARVDAADKKYNSPEKTKPTKEQISEFELAIEGLNRGTIKDFLDGKKAKYNKTGNLVALKTALGEHFNFDLNAFQESFK